MSYLYDDDRLSVLCKKWVIVVKIVNYIYCRFFNIFFIIYVMYVCVFGFEKLDFNYWSNILKIYILVSLKEKWFF